jgi:small subunit ribosomal protein S20
VNTGTNAADSAACENRLLNRFGTWEASVNADAAAEVAKYAAWTTSRPSPAIRESAVANAKMAVLTAMRRRGGLVAPGPWGGAPGPSGCRGGTPLPEVPVRVSIWARAGYSRARRGEGRGSLTCDRKSHVTIRTQGRMPCRALLSMANIKSQKKRILRSERERLENRRYTSKIKTFFRRLETAVAAGDGAQADTEHRELVQAIDKAVKRGALHRNAGARKKSRAARVRRG